MTSLRTLTGLLALLLALLASGPASAELREYFCPPTLEYRFGDDWQGRRAVSGGVPIVRLADMLIDGDRLVCEYEDHFALGDGENEFQYFAFLVTVNTVCPSEVPLFVRDPADQAPGWGTGCQVSIAREGGSSEPSLISMGPLHVTDWDEPEFGFPGCVFQRRISGDTQLYRVDRGVCDFTEVGFVCADTLTELYPAEEAAPPAGWPQQAAGPSILR